MPLTEAKTPNEEQKIATSWTSKKIVKGVALLTAAATIGIGAIATWRGWSLGNLVPSLKGWLPSFFGDTDASEETVASNTNDPIVTPPLFSSATHAKRDTDVPLGNEINLTNVTTPDYCQNPTFTVLNTNDTTRNLMFFYECQISGVKGIYNQVRGSDQNLTPVTGLMPANVFAGSPTLPKAKATPTGVVAGWNSQNQYSSTSGSDPVIRFFNNNGTAASSEKLYILNYSGNQERQDFAVYPNGTVVVTFADFSNNLNGQYAVGTFCISPDGTISLQQNVNDPGTYDEYPSTGIVDPTKHRITWRHFNSDGTRDVYYLDMASDCVTKLTTPQQANTFTAGNQDFPDIDPTGTGITYTSDGQTGHNVVYFQEIANNASLVGNETKVSTNSLGDWLPRIAKLTNENDQFQILWPNNPTGSTWHVDTQRVSNSATLDPQLQVDVSSAPTTTPDASAPWTTIDALPGTGNEYVGAYTGSASGTNNAYARVFKIVPPPITPAPQATPTSPPVTPPTANPTAPPITSPTTSPQAAPIAPPVAAPTANPTAPPITSPTASLQAAPIAPPVTPPTVAPVSPPITSPTATPQAPTPTPDVSNGPTPTISNGTTPANSNTAAIAGGAAGGGAGLIALGIAAGILLFRRKNNPQENDKKRLDAFLQTLATISPANTQHWNQALYTELNLSDHRKKPGPDEQNLNLQQKNMKYAQAFQGFVEMLAESLMTEISKTNKKRGKKSKSTNDSATTTLSGTPIDLLELTDPNDIQWLVKKIKVELLTASQQKTSSALLYEETNGIGTLIYESGPALTAIITSIASNIRTAFPERQPSETHVAMPSK